MKIAILIIGSLVTTITDSTTTESYTVCGDTSYSDSHGVISSPNYPSDYYNNLYCDYYVYAPLGSSLSFVFSSFHVDQSDIVTISCPPNSNFPPQEYSGHFLPDPVSISVCGQGRVNFRTDYTNVSSGFSVDYYVNDAGCGNTIYVGSNGYVNSPNWPDFYGYNQNCSNIIWTTEQSTIHLNFHSFNLQDNCSCDWLEISCLDNSDYGPTRFCGNYNSYNLYINQCSQVLLSFHSDDSDNYQGFSIEYTIYPFGNITSVAGTMKTTYPATDTTTQPVCSNSSYYDSNGVIQSPNFPGFYYNNLYCDYFIDAPTGRSLLFVFNSFHVDQSDIVTISCPPNSNFPPQEYSGHFVPDPLSISVCSQGRVNFLTDYTNVSNGFSINYYVNDAGCGNTVHIGSNGYVNSPNWPDFYGYNQNCSNIIWATEQSTIELNFHSFNLQDNCSCDWLEISCRDNSDYGPTRYCGNHNKYNMYIDRCSQVLLSFHSDDSDNYQGFNIEYTIYPVGDTTSVAGTMDLTPTTHPAPDTTIYPDCGETSYYGPSGVITSPNYPLLYNRNIDCYYYVHASTGSSISFIFKAFNIEANFFDYVNISCETNSSLPSRRFSGDVLPEPVSLPWCSLGVVHFHSDVENVDTGFSLNYYVSEGGCGNTVYNESHGFVVSPNWPSDYGYSQNCLNIIWAPQRSTFYLQFLDFKLHSCCDCDRLEISCMDNWEYGPYSYCGPYSYDNMSIYQCRQTLLWFRSDSSLVDSGFNIEYNVYLDGETTSVSGSTVSPPTTPTPPAGCGYGNYYGPSGVITSPNYPRNYYDSLVCQYYIIASSTSSIAIIFEHFDLQDNRDYITISCETDESFPEQLYTGHTLPPPLSIPWCSQGSLFFFTDTNEVYTGYSIDYYVSVGGCGNTTYTGSNGNITSPNYPNEYGYNVDCYNIIWASQSSHFQLEFTDFDVQISEPCQLDWVEISCLDNNPSNKHRFCGAIVYSLDFYQCTQVLVWFHSDGFTNNQGFNLEYNINVASGCGEETYYGPSGNITSPNFPEFYNNSLFCDYNIDTASPSGSIAIIFSAFFTEKCCDYVTISCATNDSYSPVELSGLIDAPPPVSIPSCSLGNVNFRTDITTGAPGFSLEYYVSTGGCGNTVYDEMPGVVSSPNYPGRYDVDQNCLNIICVEKPLLLTITFLHMNLEECCDWVELRCLDNPSYGTHRFSGNIIPHPQNIPDCGQVLVWFYSDYSSVLDGFSLQYSPAADSDIRS